MADCPGCHGTGHCETCHGIAHVEMGKGIHPNGNPGGLVSSMLGQARESQFRALYSM